MEDVNPKANIALFTPNHLGAGGLFLTCVNVSVQVAIYQRRYEKNSMTALA